MLSLQQHGMAKEGIVLGPWSSQSRQRCPHYSSPDPPPPLFIQWNSLWFGRSFGGRCGRRQGWGLEPRIFCFWWSISWILRLPRQGLLRDSFLSMICRFRAFRLSGPASSPLSNADVGTRIAAHSSWASWLSHPRTVSGFFCRRFQRTRDVAGCRLVGLRRQLKVLQDGRQLGLRNICVPKDVAVLLKLLQSLAKLKAKCFLATHSSRKWVP